MSIVAKRALFAALTVIGLVLLRRRSLVHRPPRVLRQRHAQGHPCARRGRRRRAVRAQPGRPPGDHHRGRRARHADLDGRRPRPRTPRPSSVAPTARRSPAPASGTGACVHVAVPARARHLSSRRPTSGARPRPATAGCACTSTRPVPPSRSSSPHPDGKPVDLTSLTVTVERRTWFFQALLVTLVGLLATVGRRGGLWQNRPRARATDAPTTSRGPTQSRTTRAKAEPEPARSDRTSPPRRCPHEQLDHPHRPRRRPAAWPSPAVAPGPDWSGVHDAPSQVTTTAPISAQSAEAIATRVLAKAADASAAKPRRGRSPAGRGAHRQRPRRRQRRQPARDRRTRRHRTADARRAAQGPRGLPRHGLAAADPRPDRPRPRAVPCSTCWSRPMPRRRSGSVRPRRCSRVPRWPPSTP